MKVIESIFRECEGCGEILRSEEWPWLYRSFGRLCLSCKEKAKVILKG
ncbi:MAG: hypothetical protein ABIJ08_05860 [Nanoarchaeota archaeon]